METDAKALTNVCFCIFMFVPCKSNNKSYYIPTYAQISSVNLYYITPTCFGVNTPSSGSLQLCQLKLWIIKMINYNKLQYSNVL